MSLHLSVQYFLEDEYEIITTDQYDLIIITDCRYARFCFTLNFRFMLYVRVVQFEFILCAINR